MMRQKTTPSPSLRKRKRSSVTATSEPNKKISKIETTQDIEVKEKQTISLQDTLRNLKDKTKSFVNRLQIACDLWENAEMWQSISKDLIHIQLLQWLSFNIVSTYKNPKKEKFYLQQKAWNLIELIESSYLSRFLSSDFIDESTVPQETKLPTHLLLAMGEFLSDSVEKNNTEGIIVITKLCKVLLRLQWFRPAITIEQFSKFLITSLQQSTIIGSTNIECVEYLKALENILEQFQNFLHQQSNHKKLFSVVLSQLLPLFLKVSFTLDQSNATSETKQLQIKISQMLRECLSSVLFITTDCSHYGNDKQLVSYHHQLYTALATLCTEFPEQLQALPFLMESYIKAIRSKGASKTSQMNFYESDFFGHLFSILINCTTAHNTSNSNTMTDISGERIYDIIFIASEELLGLLISNTVNIPNRDEVNSMFDGFVQSTIQSMNKDNHDLQWNSLTQLLQIQHTSVLSCLEETLYPLLVQYKLGDMQIEFIIGLMNLYSKLHQSENFLVSFLNQIHSRSSQFYSTLHEYTKLWISFAEFASSLSPHKEYETIWLCFTHDFDTLMTESNETSISHFDVISQLFIIFLDNIKITENNATRVKELITQTCENLISPRLKQLGLLYTKKPSINKKKSLMMISTLGIYSCLCTLHNHSESLLFKSYHSNILQTGFLQPETYFSLLYESQEEKTEQVNVLHVMQLVDLCANDGLLLQFPKLFYSLGLVAIQRIYDLHSCSVSVIEGITEELKQLSEIIVTKSLEIWNSCSAGFLKQSWNRNPFHIDESNIGVAMFSLICQNLFFISHYLSSQNIQVFLRFLFHPDFICSAFQPQPHSKSITPGFLLNKLLENDQFYELHAIRLQVPFTIKSLFAETLIPILSPKSSSTSSIISKLAKYSGTKQQKHFGDLMKEIRTGNASFSLVSAGIDNISINKLLYITSLLGAFPCGYLAANHWSEIISFVFLCEEFVCCDVSGKNITMEQFQLICECRRCIIHAIQAHNEMKQENSLVSFFRSCLEHLFFRTCSLISCMSSAMQTSFGTLNAKLFSGICSLELHQSLLTTENTDLCSPILKIFDYQQTISNKSSKTTKTAGIIQIALLEYLLAWLQCMTHHAGEQENICELKSKQARRHKNVKRIQETTQKIINSTLAEDSESSSDSESDSDSDSSDSDMETEESKPVTRKLPRVNLNTFHIPDTWKTLETEIYNRLVFIISSTNIEKLSQDEKIKFLASALESFAALVDFNRTWYSKYLRKDTTSSVDIPKPTGMILLFQLSREISDVFRASSTTECISDDSCIFVENLRKVWNSIQPTGSNRKENKILRETLRFINAICGSLNLPMCSKVNEKEILFVADLTQELLSEEYSNFSLLSFSPANHFDDSFEASKGSPSVCLSSSLVIQLLEVYSRLARSCPRNHLQTLLQRIHSRLQSTQKQQTAAAVMCLYQIFTNGITDARRGKVISSVVTQLLSGCLQVLYTNSGDKCLERWIIEVFHCVITAKKLHFSGNVVANVLACFPSFTQCRISESIKTMADEEEQKISFQAPIANPLDVNASMFIKQSRFLSDCLLHRASESFHALPSFVHAIRLLAATLGTMCHVYLHSTRQSSSENDLVHCIRCFSRLLEDFGSKAQATRLYVPTLIVDLIYILQHYSISPKQRTELQPGLFKLLDVCHEKDRKHVFVLLDNTGKLIFKELYEKYNRDFKFTGKT